MKHVRYSLLSLFLGAISFLIHTGKAEAQVIVYELQFKKLPGGVNHVVFDRGFVVMDGSTRTGTFIFAGETKIDGIKRSIFVRSDDSAEFFVAARRISTNRVLRKLVMRASAGDGTSTSSYLATGDIDTRVKGFSNQLEVTVAAATRMEGFCLSSDDESAEDFASDVDTLGYAGAAAMALRLSRKRTGDANSNGQTVSETADDLVVVLENEGFDDLTELTAEDTETDTDTTTSASVETGEVN